MRTSLPAAALFAVLALTVSACGDAAPPDRPPDTTGLVGVQPGEPEELVLTDSSDEYYEGMTLLPAEVPEVFDAETGQVIPVEEVTAGDRVEVWTGGACAESYPVQCDIEALRVTRQG